MAVWASDVVTDCVLLQDFADCVLVGIYILDGALWVVAANGEGQRKYLEDIGQNSWPEQFEGNVQPDAFPVKEETQARWMLVNCKQPILASGQIGQTMGARQGANVRAGSCCCASVFPCAGV